MAKEDPITSKQIQKINQLLRGKGKEPLPKENFKGWSRGKASQFIEQLLQTQNKDNNTKKTEKQRSKHH